MFIPMLALKFIALLGIGCLISMLLIIVVFGPEAYRFARREWAGQFPFDAPVWWSRLTQLLCRNRAEVEAYTLLVAVFFLLWLGMVITHPFQ